MLWFTPRAVAASSVEVKGAKHSLANDWYHVMLRAPWWFDLLTITTAFLVLNVVFAIGYLATGGVTGARPGNFADVFFFSVQTMATIGYGSMYPSGVGAHALVTVEALISILVVALCTGLVFAKFSVVRARVRFAQCAVITPFNGVPTLMIRIGNLRRSSVIDLATRVVLTRTEHTSEGVMMYRMYDLRLERDHAPALSRAWMILHRITEDSPLYQSTPPSLARDEVELLVTVRGIDETSGQSLHTRRTYVDHEVHWGARYEDMISEKPDGSTLLDLTRFDQLRPSLPTPAFPYPARGESS